MSNYEKILKFLGYRLVRFIILLIAIIIISFIMVDLSPINPVKTYISNMIVSPEQVAALEAYWGVNEPITAKIMNWLGNIIHGDLGNSLIFRIPVIDVIKEKFDLERVSDVLWLKFTDKGHLAVVAKSCDINWDSEQSCGLLVQEIGESFDTSFAFVFPLTRQMIRTKAEPNSFYRKYSSEELECAVGNYLISKGVPIIDYFSHMGYKYDILAENM